MENKMIQGQVQATIFNCCISVAILMLIPHIENLVIDCVIRGFLFISICMFLVQRIHSLFGKRDNVPFQKILMGICLGLLLWGSTYCLSIPVTILMSVFGISFLSIILTSSLAKEGCTLSNAGYSLKYFLQGLDILK